MSAVAAVPGVIDEELQAELLPRVTLEDLEDAHAAETDPNRKEEFRNMINEREAAKTTQATPAEGQPQVPFSKEQLEAQRIEVENESIRNAPIGATPAPSWYPEVSNRTPGGIVDNLFGQTIDNMASQPAYTQYGGGPNNQSPLDMEEGLQKSEEIAKGNLDWPGATAGAYAGGRLGGMVGGVPGAVIGGVLGGMAGGYYGSELSDYLMGDVSDANSDQNWDNAVEGGLIDMGVYATGIVYKPLGRIMGLYDADLIRGANQFYREMAEDWVVPARGTPESKVATQGLLTNPKGGLPEEEAKNAGLTAYQAAGTSFTQFFEKWAQMSLSAGDKYVDRAIINAATIKDYISEMAYQAVDGVVVNSADLPAAYAGTMEAGRQANLSIYNNNMALIKRDIGKTSLRPYGLLRIFDDFETKFSVNVGTDLAPEAQKIINTYRDLYGSDRSKVMFDVESAINLNTTLNETISGLLDPMQLSSERKKAHAQLSELKRLVTTRITRMITAVDPEQAKLFTKTNTDFGTARSDMFPPITVPYLQAASKEDFAKVGRDFTTANASQVQAVYDTLDAAYTQIGIREGMESLLVSDNYYVAASSLLYSTPAQAKQALLQGWLQAKFLDLSGPFDATETKFSSMAKELEDPLQAATAKVVMGADYGKYKLVLNALSDMSQKSPAEAGMLALRGMEVSSFSAALVTPFTGSGLAMAGSTAYVAAMFGTPIILSKIISNPSAVNALLQGKKRLTNVKAGSVKVFSKAVQEIYQEVWDTLSEEDKEDVRKYYTDSTGVDK